MSQENLDIARRGYEAFNRDDQEAMVADLGSAFEYFGTGAVPGSEGRYQGARGWSEAVSWLRDEFDEPRIEVRELIEQGDKVLAGIAMHGRGKRSGAKTSWELWQLWTIRDGEVVLGQGFRTRDQALEAAAVRES